jgi:multidrug efflux system membrane fusion protein
MSQSDLIAAPEHPQALLSPPPGSTPAPEPPKVAPPAPAPSPKPRRRVWLWVVILVILLASGIFFFSRGKQPAAAGKNGTSAAKGGRGAPAATPVVAVKATRGNIGVYVSGLGAITPISTVTVKSRVDGQLMAVHFNEGQLVNKGDPLIEIDPRPYEAAVLQAEGQLIRDQALLDNARTDQTRYTTLLAQNAIPEQQLTTQKALVIQYEGTVKNDQGLLDAAKVNVGYCHITAQITGIVGLRLVDPGNIVHAADTNGMLVITQIQPISVIFPISEDQLPAILQKVRAGQKLSVEAWDRAFANKLASGTLETIDNEIDQTTGTVKLRATFANDNRALFPNQFVNARVLQQEKTGVTLLPTAAIQRNTNSTYVYLVKPDSTVTVRTIQVGTTEGDQSEITSGLSPGDEAVMTGVDKLQEGSKVAVTQNGAK